MKELITTITGKQSTWRIYKTEDGLVGAEVEYNDEDSKGTVLLEDSGYGLAFGFEGRYEQDEKGPTDPLVGLFDLFYVTNPATEEHTRDQRRSNNPQVVINDPGGDAICFVHFAPQEPVVSFEQKVERFTLDTASGQEVYYGYEPLPAEPQPAAAEISTPVRDMWQTLGDVPVNDEGRIDAPFLAFPAGTDREDIWRWFETTFNVSVAKDLMEL